MGIVKDILVKDLCGRLPYGVVCRIETQDSQEKDIILDKYNISHVFEVGVGMWKRCRPYLRPMSSMGEDDMKVFQSINWQFTKSSDGSCYVGEEEDGYCSVGQMAEIIENLNARHFDYRGFIQDGAALEAPEGMY